ncbi:MAG: PAS domain S-box protein [Deltaproteobacteria bacterium]|nr:PAS domain S-box protein [Deltaproteobacteria bacterium]
MGSDQDRQKIGLKGILYQFIDKLSGISLKWKLLIPFLFFAFAGTSVLTYIGLSSQFNLIQAEEQKRLTQYYDQFLEDIDHKKTQALSMASVIAGDPEVCELLSQRNRQTLHDLLIPTYFLIKSHFDVEQFHFHIPPAVSFLRLHAPERFGDDLSASRSMIPDVMRSGKPVAGIEKGETGFGIRGVVPVIQNEKMVGTLEIGHSFGAAFLNEIHQRRGIDLNVFEITGAGECVFIAGSDNQKDNKNPESSPEKAIKGSTPVILIAPESTPDRSILYGQVPDYSGEPLVIVEIRMDRSEVQKRLSRTRNLMILVGLIGIAVSFLLTFLVTLLFVRPIKEIVHVAQDIALEKRESRLKPRPGDEIGALTEALNTMLDSLKQRRTQLQEHSKTLEKKVFERTNDLVSSEEKYRTLVENVPLIVYRVLSDGTTEFVNPYLSESLGYTAEDAVGDKRFWLGRISAPGSKGYKKVYQNCFLQGNECRLERSLQGKDGRILTFIEHAIPAKDEKGRVKWIDGIMMDITELKRLQERALRTEEIRIMGEISALVAHEIRNPLATAGGFARRLRDSFEKDDPHYQSAQIIVDQVARLENFLKVLFASIQPFDLIRTKTDPNLLLDKIFLKMEGLFQSKDVHLVKNLHPSLTSVWMDESRLTQALESLLRHAVVSIPQGETIRISTDQVGENLVITLSYKVHSLSDDDMEKFFFPHMEEDSEGKILMDLPLSRVIIHRHGGTIDVKQDADQILTIEIELPIQSHADEMG